MESALFNLKAELVKKKEEALAENRKKNEAGRKKQLERKLLKQTKVKTHITLPEAQEQTDLAKSRVALERKSVLYDKMKDGTGALEDEELNERFLVNFQEKIREKFKKEKEDSELKSQSATTSLNSDEDESSWVEYVDSFGRTRKCLVDDLEYFKQMDRDVAGPSSEPPLKPEDPVTVKLREHWNKVEQEAHNKRDIHYEDVLFNEARDHGVGYVAFSRNEAERQKQQQILKDFRQEANKATKNVKKEKALKDKKMKIRLEKVREKKRLKMGLPVKDICEKRLATPPSSDNEDDQEPEKIPELPPLNLTTETETKPLREWDIGKTTKHGTVLTQKQWVESRRKQRDTNFAPPSQYNVTKKRKTDDVKLSDWRDDSYASMTDERRSPDTSSRNPQFAPPLTFDYYNGASKRHHQKPKIDIEAAISRGIAAFRKASDQS